MVLDSFFIGILATAAMDTTSVLGTRLGLLRKPNVALLGRWTLLLLEGRWATSDIRTEAPKRLEKPLGLALHYSIGVVLAAAYLLLPAARNGISIAVAFGLLTNVFPWFLMFPSMGFGVAGERSPPEALLFRTSLVGHLVYGLGLWLGISLFF